MLDLALLSVFIVALSGIVFNLVERSDDPESYFYLPGDSPPVILLMVGLGISTATLVRYLIDILTDMAAR